MKYKEWQNRPQRFLAMTGYTIDQFKLLLPYFEHSHNEYLTHYQMNGKIRNGLRSYVMYKNSPLSDIAERLAFILSYLKLNPIQESHADMFSLEQYQCCEMIHGLKKILDKALENADCVPSRNNIELQNTLSQIPEEEKVILHDGTEREIPRPQDDEDQQNKYSGKKKKHTIKNAVIVSSCCLVLYVSPSLAGRIHDKAIADSEYTIPQGFTIYQDTGYQGYCPPGVKVIQPMKKPKGKELTQEQKEVNRKISSFRIRVEHAIGSIKRNRIVKDECRLRKDNFVENIFVSCAALHNFRLKINPFQYKNKSI